jgi:hypothetical protein
MRKVWLVIIFMIMFLWTPQSVLAAESGITGFWAAGSAEAAAWDGDTANLPLDAVSWWLDDDGSYKLFLPSTADLSSLKIWFDADDAVYVDSAMLASNANTMVFAQAGVYTLTCGDQSYQLTVMQSSHVSAMFMATTSGTMENIDGSEDHSVSEEGDMLLVEDDGNVVYNDALSQVKGRGNHTWTLLKKPYQIKLDNKTNLLGMGKAKTWVLLSNYTDPSFLRNKLVLECADGLGMAYTSQSAFVDLYANHQYLGNYLLCEKVQIKTNRIEITDLEAETESLNLLSLDEYDRGGHLGAAKEGTSKWYEIPNNPADITGGYLLEFEFPSRYVDEASGFVTDRGQPIVIKSPEYATEEQVTYISDYVQELEDAIFSENGYNSEGKHYSAYIDVDSLVYRYLIEEWSRNNDGGISSFYLYKDSNSVDDGKLYAGPVWDYDLAFGSSGRYRVYTETAEKMRTKDRVDWYAALFDHKTFVNKVDQVYSTAFIPAVDDLLAGNIEQWVAEISDSAAMDEARWTYADQENVDFGESISVLKNYIDVRTDYLNENFFTNDTYFKDVAEKVWYYKSVMYVADNGYMQGVGGQMFLPNQSLTRAMVVTVLSRVSGDDLSAYTSSAFTDVDQGQWYTAPIAWAADKGIVTGYDNQTFLPHQSITREELALMIKNYASYKGLDMTIEDTALDGFSDSQQVSSWAKDALCWCKSSGLIQGISETELGPKAMSTRAQFCTILKRYLK